ncbi:hypothetical protein EBT25_08330 [bacterium]|nr:hypothetical protein [bacterium]
MWDATNSEKVPSGRLTSQWTETLGEAFGERGERGREAELWLFNVLAKFWKWEVIDHEGDINRQKKGHDLSIRAPHWKHFYTVDVKGNMRDDGSFFVETGKDGWLRKQGKTNDRVWHVNVRTGWMAWYDPKDMINYLRQTGRMEEGLLLINPTDCKRFISRRKHVA